MTTIKSPLSYIAVFENLSGSHFGPQFIQVELGHPNVYFLHSQDIEPIQGQQDSLALKAASIVCKITKQTLFVFHP